MIAPISSGPPSDLSRSRHRFREKSPVRVIGHGQREPIRLSVRSGYAPGIHIRAAQTPDIQAVVDLLSEAAAWTAGIGFANWPSPFPRSIVAEGVERGELFVADIGDLTVAALALTWSDPVFWGDQPDDAGYVHRLVVRRDYTASGRGAALLDWAAAQVLARGRAWLRVDATTGNLPLRSYYERLGFQGRGDVEGVRVDAEGHPQRWTTHRYERACTSEKSR